MNSLFINAQELPYNEIQNILSKSVESTFPARFNSDVDTKDMFQGICNEFPGFCRKLRFQKFTGFRINKVSPIYNETETTVEAYLVSFEFDFHYVKGKKDFYGNATLTSKLNKVLDHYSVISLRFERTSGRHYGFKDRDQTALVLVDKQTQ
jgi:hypothetical protein